MKRLLNALSSSVKQIISEKKGEMHRECITPKKTNRKEAKLKQF